MRSILVRRRTAGHRGGGRESIRDLPQTVPRPDGWPSRWRTATLTSWQTPPLRFATSSSAPAGRCGCGPPVAGDAEAVLAFLARAVGAERLSPLPRLPGAPARDGRAVPGSGLARPRCADRRRCRTTAASRSSRSPTTSACATRRARKSRSRSQTRCRGRGSGTRLLEQLAATAAAQGISTFVAEVMPDNAPMLGVFADAGFAVSRRLEGGTTEVRLEIAPTGPVPRGGRRARPRRRRSFAGAVLRAARRSPWSARRRGAARSAASSSATSSTRTSTGSSIPSTRRLRRSPACGPTPRSRTFPTPSTWRSSAFRRASVLDEAEAAMRKGTRALCVISAGLRRDRGRGHPQPGAAARAGARPRRAADRPELPRDLRRRPGPERDLRAPQLPRREHRLLVAERRARAGGARARRPRGGSGFSAFVSVGNKADVSSNDLLEYWEDDPSTDLDPALPRVVRQPAQVRPRSRGGSPGRSRSWR